MPLRSGEALDSWLDRNAAAFAASRIGLVRAHGLPAGLTAVRHELGSNLTAAEIFRLASVFTVSVDALSASIEPVRSAEVLAERTSRGFRHAELAPTRSSRYCSLCLKERRGWLIEWRLPWNEVCLRHGAVLTTGCPHCGSAQRARGAGPKHVKQPGDLHSDYAITTCRYCAADLTTAEIAKPTRAKLATAEFVVANHSRLGDERCQMDIRGLTVMSRRQYQARRLVSTAVVVAAALGDPQCLDQIAQGVPLNRPSKGLPELLKVASPGLQESLLDRIRPKLSGVLYLRTYTRLMTGVAASQGDAIARFVPAAIWPSVLREALPHTHSGATIASRALSLATVMTGNNLPESDAAGLLGLGYAQICAQRVLAPVPAEVLSGLADVADRCQRGRIPICYENRRRIAARTTLITPGEWNEIRLLAGLDSRAAYYEFACVLARTVFTGSAPTAMESRSLGRSIFSFPHEALTRIVRHLAHYFAAEYAEPLVWDFDSDADSLSNSMMIRERAQQGESAFVVAESMALTIPALVAIMARTAEQASAILPPSPQALPVEMTAQALVADYESGKSLRVLAQEHGVDRKRISAIINLRSQTRRGRTPMYKVDPAWLSERHRTTTLRQIARELGVSNSTVARMANQAGLPSRRGTNAHAKRLPAQDQPPPAATRMFRETRKHMRRLSRVDTQRVWEQLGSQSVMVSVLNHSYRGDVPEPLRTLFQSYGYDPFWLGRICRVVLLAICGNFQDFERITQVDVAKVRSNLAYYEAKLGTPLFVANGTELEATETGAALLTQLHPSWNLKRLGRAGPGARQRFGTGGGRRSDKFPTPGPPRTPSEERGGWGPVHM